MKKILLCCLFHLAFCTIIFAQAPSINSVFPIQNEISAGISTNIVIEFDEAIDLSTVDYANFKVFGRWSGPAEVVFSMSNDNKTVTMDPFKPYFAGEWVTVTLGKGIKSNSGVAMEKGFSWHFWVATQTGFLNQPLVKQINLREEGEGLIQSYGAYAGDINNDGFSDLTVVNETSDDIRILLNDGAGDYNDFDITDLGMGKPSPNEGGDFDGDGEIDLVITSVDSEDINILFGDGEGNLGDQETFIGGNGVRGVIVADLNGDAVDDILAVSRNASNMTLMMNNNDGTFTTTTINPYADGIGATACAPGDVNNDGLIDLFVGYYETGELVTLINDGNGNFVLGNTIETNSRPWMIASGDLNGDGFIDVASANSNGNVMVVSFNDGNGNLSNPLYYSTGNASFPLAIDMGDLDGDGDLDIVTSNYSSITYSVFENLELGFFELAHTLDAVEHASCAILHDRDNDGDLDITATDEGVDVVLFFENTMSTSAGLATNENINVQVSPNPFEQQILIEFELPNAASIDLRLYNNLGQLVRQKTKTQFPSGKQEISWNLKNKYQLPTGIYFLELEYDGKKVRKEIVKSY